MTSMTMNVAREACTVEACVHEFHDVDRGNPEDFAFHETATIGVDREWDVRVTRFANEREWSVDAQIRVALTAEEALAVADAIRLSAGMAYELNKEMF